MNQSSISQNTATDCGGGLYNNEDAIHAALIGSGISFNIANTQNQESGGGIFSAASDANLELNYINLVLNWPNNTPPHEINQRALLIGLFWLKTGTSLSTF